MTMNRQDFLRGVLAHGALLGLGGGALAASPPPLLLRTGLRGHVYHDAPRALHRLKVGDALLPVREPDNPHDERAVALHWHGHHLGYLPREHNRVVATLMDQGVPLTATLVELRDAEHWAPCVVELRLS